MVKHGIPGEMEQNLIKEAIHLHLLSVLSDKIMRKIKEHRERFRFHLIEKCHGGFLSMGARRA